MWALQMEPALSCYAFAAAWLRARRRMHGTSQLQARPQHTQLGLRARLESSGTDAASWLSMSLRPHARGYTQRMQRPTSVCGLPTFGEAGQEQPAADRLLAGQAHAGSGIGAGQAQKVGQDSRGRHVGLAPHDAVAVAEAQGGWVGCGGAGAATGRAAQGAQDTQQASQAAADKGSLLA